MEKWKSGKMKNGMLERFYHGDTEITELEEWKSGRMDEFDNSTIRQWKNGMLERFYHGGTEITELEEWKDG
jgi:hypothetical protein